MHGKALLRLQIIQIEVAIRIKFILLFISMEVYVLVAIDSKSGKQRSNLIPANNTVKHALCCMW